MSALQDQQKTEALARANQVRAAHANIRAKLSCVPSTDGLKEVARLLSIHDQRIKRLPVKKLLCYCRHIGPTKAEWIVARAQVSGSKRVDDLSDSARERLIVQVRRAING